MVPVLWAKYEKLLSLPFHESELEWKPQSGNTNADYPKLTIVPYVDARAIRRRLNQVFGLFGWQFSVSYIPGEPGWRKNKDAQLPGIVGVLQILRPDGQWITKCEVCEFTHIEPMKGAASGALKRVAASIGVGSYLYDMPPYELTLKNGGLVADKPNYNSGHVKFWGQKVGAETRKFFWRVPSGVGSAPGCIGQEFLPSASQASAFHGWTFDPTVSKPPVGGMMTAHPDEPSGPSVPLDHSVEPSRNGQATTSPERAMAPRPVAPPPAPSSPPVPRNGQHTAADCIGGVAGNSPPQMDSSTEFGRLWNFALMKRSALNYDKFLDAVMDREKSQVIDELEGNALRTLSRIVQLSDGMELAKEALYAAQAFSSNKINLGHRDALLKTVSALSASAHKNPVQLAV